MPSKRMRNKIAGWVTVRARRAVACAVLLLRCCVCGNYRRLSTPAAHNTLPLQHLMRRIERGDQVRGISLKLQEEERERRMDFVPEESAINTEKLTVAAETADLLKKINVSFAGDVHVQKVRSSDAVRPGKGDRPPRRT